SEMVLRTPGSAGRGRAGLRPEPGISPRCGRGQGWRCLSIARTLTFGHYDEKSPQEETSMSQKSQSPKTTRRNLELTGAPAAAPAAVSPPAVVKAQGPTNLRFQSTWPSKDIFHEFAQDYAKKVNDMTGGDLKIEVLPAGAVVPAFGLLEAVSKGT